MARKMVLTIAVFALFLAAVRSGDSSSDESQHYLKMPEKIDDMSRRLSEVEIERRINQILAQMTLDEKIGQLQQTSGVNGGDFLPETAALARAGLLGSVLNIRGAHITNTLQRHAMQSRLKIPLVYGFDTIHGYRTLFPIPLGETATWDRDAVELAASIAATESRATGIHWTFAPMVDVMRDARWGRIMEGSGEDVFLGSEMAKARVRGFQGDDYSRPDKVMACAKHFAAYGAAEAGRDYNTVDMSERRLREIYLPPFQAAVEAGVGSFMTAFNELNGVPATGNKWLLRDVLRDEWKFDGLVVSDWDAVIEMNAHQYSANDSEAARYALNAGTDMEMNSRSVAQHGRQLVENGKVSVTVIDNAVRNVLRAKFRLGLFDNPYVDERLENSTFLKPEFLQAARNITARSLVLLKNENHTLPISKHIRRIAVIGALGSTPNETLSHWSADARPSESITILQGIRAKLPDTNVIYEKGCEVYCTTDKDFAEAVEAVNYAGFAIVVVGEPKEYSGEAGSRSMIGLPGRQLDLLKRIKETGKPFVVVLMNGRPMTIEWVAENAPAILVTWRAGTMGGHAIADVLFGDVNPSGKLPMSFPRNLGQIPIHYDMKNTGRPIDKSSATLDQRYRSKYLDVANDPLYTFGFGLSYTTFAFENFTLNTTTLTADESLGIRVEVVNTGNREGEEVVQLYLRDVASSITRPVRQLRGFRKINLAVQERKRVDFVLTRRDLGFLDKQWKLKVEAGTFEVYIGNSSDTIMMKTFTVTTTKIF
ncbi:hypothetical protein RvY_12140 [Ramazzottius varieornatus]|uniref:beta-glucosidase n=1 Tax=Ramazzottius varieornatus TaxID=947166 RepID=A0A1D1VIF2_RAMVA|nr:hypothetical protein RvY_12140 [Ramazzottius varieornatus]